MRNIGTIRANPLVVNGSALCIAIFTYLAIYRGIWDISPPQWAKGPGFLLLIVLAGMLLLLHEAIHMLTANLLTSGAGASLHIRMLVWECRLKKPLARNGYILYALAPAIVIGGASFISFYIVNSADYKFLAALAFVIGISSAGGDYWFVAKILRFPRRSMILDNGMETDVQLADDSD